MMRFPLPFILTAALLFSGPGACDRKPAAAPPAPPAATLTVFAAASLAEAFGEIGPAFERGHPGVRVVFNFAGSQQLRTQLDQGAPCDVFASANRKEMDGATAAGLVKSDSVHTFARNKLVVVVPKSNPGAVQTLADLARPGLKIDVADPAVPVGRYTEQMLDRLAADPAYGPGFKTKFAANVVSREDNVKAVVAKVRLGEADAGVVYATDAAGNAGKELTTLPVPEAFNPTAEYPIGVAAKAGRGDAAGEFVAFVLSADGQGALKRYGFLPGE